MFSRDIRLRSLTAKGWATGGETHLRRLADGFGQLLAQAQAAERRHTPREQGAWGGGGGDVRGLGFDIFNCESRVITFAQCTRNRTRSNSGAVTGATGYGLKHHPHFKRVGNGNFKHFGA